MELDVENSKGCIHRVIDKSEPIALAPEVENASLVEENDARRAKPRFYDARDEAEQGNKIQVCQWVSRLKVGGCLRLMYNHLLLINTPPV